MVQLLAAFLGPANDLGTLAAGLLQGLALGDDDLGVQLRLTQHLLHFLLGGGHILLPRPHQLLRLLDLQRQLGPDIVQQIQRLITADDALIRAEGRTLGLVDHAVKHIQQPLHILLFHKVYLPFSSSATGAGTYFSKGWPYRIISRTIVLLKC